MNTLGNERFRWKLRGKSMICKKTALALLLLSYFLVSNSALAEDAVTTVMPPTNCSASSDPYTNYACLDSYLGENIFSRFINYYRLEMGHATAPADPNAPLSRRDGWP